MNRFGQTRFYKSKQSTTLKFPLARVCAWGPCSSFRSPYDYLQLINLNEGGNCTSKVGLRDGWVEVQDPQRQQLRELTSVSGKVFGGVPQLGFWETPNGPSEVSGRGSVNHLWVVIGELSGSRLECLGFWDSFWQFSFFFLFTNEPGLFRWMVVIFWM